MYCSDFICTYKSLNNEVDSNLMYQQQLLQAFDVKELDNFDNISQEITNIYNKLKENKDVKKILECLKINGPNMFLLFDKNDNEMLFQILFSYDYFDLFHRCLIDYYKSNCITKTHIDLLMKSIN